MVKTRIEISLLLPQIPDARDGCVERLRDLLAAKQGVDSAHTLSEDGTKSDEICIHHDPDRLSIADVRELGRRAARTIWSPRAENRVVFITVLLIRALPTP